MNQGLTFFGHMYSCKNCGELRGEIQGKDYSIEEYELLRKKFVEDFKLEENGQSALSMMAEDVVCPKCKNKAS